MFVNTYKTNHADQSSTRSMKKIYTRMIKHTIVARKSFKPPFRNHVTASKMPAFAHQDDYASAKETALRTFNGKASPKRDDFCRSALEHGTFSEVIAKDFIKDQAYFKKYKFDLPENDGQWSITGTWMHKPTHQSFMFSATPDMMIIDPDTLDCIPIEIKCPYLAYMKNFELNATYFKTSHWIQLAAQCILLGSSYGYLAVFIPGRRVGDKEQLIVWKVMITEWAQRFILDLVFQTYDTLNGCKTEEDYKVFKAKKGLKLQIKTAILEEIRNSEVIINTNNSLIQE